MNRDTDESKLEAKIKAVNQYAEDVHSIHFAIGTYTVYENDDIRTAKNINDI